MVHVTSAPPPLSKSRIGLRPGRSFGKALLLCGSLALIPPASQVHAQTAPQAAPRDSACPAPQPIDTELSQLIAEIQAAPSEAAAREINDRMWALWTKAPDERAQSLLDEGIARRGVYDYLGARAEFDRLVAYCPDYAEGYNQRAFIAFLQGDFARARRDLDVALRLSPRHIGALSGLALTLMESGATSEAARVLAQALALNPWLPERHLATPGGPLAPPEIKL